MQLRLLPSQLQRLDAFAEKHDSTRSEVLRLSLDYYLDSVDQ